MRRSDSRAVHRSHACARRTARLIVDASLHLALARLEARLDSSKFVRIHRTHIANLNHVTAFRRREGGRFVAVMTDGSALPVIRERAKELRILGV